MRPINLDKDYATISEWWTEQQWPVIPADCLPTYGLIADGLCAGFLYETDSKIAWIEWIVGNPRADKLARRQALDALIDGLSERARSKGNRIVFTAASHSGLKARLTERGFALTDGGMSHFIRSL
jgi:hypothetical protein